MNSEKLIRIFRADTPHDIYCATLVADRLSTGDNYLLFNTDYSKDASGFEQTMLIASAVHPWKNVIDISGLPVNRHHELVADTVSKKIIRLRETISSTRQLRELIVTGLGCNENDDVGSKDVLSRVDEIYLNCVHHPEVQIMYRVFPDARFVYYPHGFDSLHGAEIGYYNQYLIPGKIGLGQKIGNSIKHLIFGKESYRPETLWIDEVYTLNKGLTGAGTVRSLKKDLTAESLRDLLERTGEDVFSYFDGLRRRLKGKAAVLLIFVESRHNGYPIQIELQAYKELVRKMVQSENIESVLIKPHPLTSDKWIAEVEGYLNRNLPDVIFVSVKDYRFLPIEVVASIFNLTTCAGIGSSSMRTLQNIYGLRTFHAPAVIPKLFKDSPLRLAGMSAWLEDTKGEFEEVEISFETEDRS